MEAKKGRSQFRLSINIDIGLFKEAKAISVVVKAPVGQPAPPILQTGLRPEPPFLHTSLKPERYSSAYTSNSTNGTLVIVVNKVTIIHIN